MHAMLARAMRRHRRNRASRPAPESPWTPRAVDRILALRVASRAHTHLLSQWLGGSPPWRSHGIARCAALALVLLLAIAATRIQFEQLVGRQEPRLFLDSETYLETTRRPISIEQFFYSKPFTVPAIYRVADADAQHIETLQQEFAFASWWILGGVLLACLRRPAAQVLVLVAIPSLLLAPLRLGWTSTILSESIVDSLMALLFAVAVALACCATRMVPSRRRTGACTTLTVLLLLITLVWIFARDTNSVIALVSVAAGAVIWRIHRTLRSNRWALALLVVPTVAALVSLWTAAVLPERPTGISFHDPWVDEAVPRKTYPLVNNLFNRILTDPRALEFYVARGMPYSDALMSHAGKVPDHDKHVFLRDPASRPLLQWLNEHGTSTYARWLLSRPLEKSDELARRLWSALNASGLPDSHYMPYGWVNVGQGHALVDHVRGASRREGLLLVLLLATPLLIHLIGRGDPLRGVAMCAILSGVFGAAASYYADAMETNRHGYGASQQILTAIVLVLVAYLDRRRRGDGGHGPAPPADRQGGWDPAAPRCVEEMRAPAPR
jgi:hypothetical protein